MRLKFYLMGLGIGVIVAAVIMGIAMRGRTREMTDEEIMARARQLGMVEAGTLAEIASGENNQNTEQSAESIEQQKPEETVVAQTNATVTEGREAAGENGTDGTAANAADNPARAENGESAGAFNSADRAGASQSMVVEGEPVDDEEETDASVEENAETGASDREDAEDHEQGNEGSHTVAAASDDEDDEDDADHSPNSAASGSSSSESAQAAGSIVVTIPDGLFSEDIAALLETAGVVDNAAAFNDYLCNSGQDRYITVGARLIPRGSSYEDVARIITGR